MGAQALLLLLLLLGLTALAHCQPLYNMATPSVLRVDSEEAVLIEAHGRTSAVEVAIIVYNFPQKKSVLDTTSVLLNSANGYLGVAKIRVPVSQMEKDSKINQYVYVQAIIEDIKLEKEVLVSISSGYIFIQTDKTIYTPGTKVQYRLFTAGHNLEPTYQAVQVELVNPDGITVEKQLLSSSDQSGILSTSYTIPEIVNLGFWKIVARYQHALGKTYSTEFEVKEYVLPSFEVNVEFMKKYYHIEDDAITIVITANYLHGNPVQGSAYILFGVLINNEKKNIPNSLDKVQITDGKGNAKLTKDMLRSRFPNYNELLGWSIYVTVTVMTNTGSEMVEAEKTGIQIVNSPYKIAFTKSPQYFKPGLIYPCVVSVMHPDNSPASRVPVKTVNPAGYYGLTQEDGTLTLNLNTQPGSSQLPITVQTLDGSIQEDRQGSASMAATAYKGHGIYKNYLHIGIPSTVIKPGGSLMATLYIWNENMDIQEQIQHFTYLILNKGQIVKIGRQQRLSGQSVISMSLQITAELIPSFRLVVYYCVQNGAQKEIVADAVWVDMEDTCMGTLNIATVANVQQAYQPGKSVKMKLTGDPGAQVGIVAVDKAVYVLNRRNKLSQTKVWDLVEKNDAGCTPGSGSNNAGVFTDAGLSFQTNSDKGNTLPRTDFQCPHTIRTRRAAMSPRAKAAKAQQYQIQQHRKCCEDGMHENPMGYSCDKRATYILDGTECTKAFLDCCKHVFEKPAKQKLVLWANRRPLIRQYSKGTNVRLETSDADEDDYVADEDIVSRSQFAESWLWQTYSLPSEANKDGLSTTEFTAHLQESITTWELLAISFSQKKGICVAKPYEIRVTQVFFIDLRLPYSVVRNEQVEIRAVLHNYLEHKITVRVELIYNEDICSSSSRESRFQEIIEINPGSTHVIPYVIIPLKIGELEIEVKAAGVDFADGVRKKLKVVPEGMRILKNVKSIILDPGSSGDENGIQTVRVEPISLHDVVPNTEPLTFISVKGDIVGETVENSIDGANLKHLITVPVGCGEQNMITMTPAVIATHYLDNTNQWGRLGVARRAEATRFIQMGYTQQLAYRKQDNSYAAFVDRPSSTWLTAYVVKVFSMANNLIFIDRSILCGAVKWLIQEKQKPDGLFQEDAPVIHGEMVGGAQGSEPEASLTAFVLIALVEAKDICSSTVNHLDTNIAKAAKFLEDRINGLKKVYSITISSYALALVDRSKGENKLMEHSTGGTHWHDPTSKLYTIEATSYALLTMLKKRNFAAAAPIIQWLIEQRYYGGGYGSTQATILVFQALSKYQAEKPTSNEITMDVSLSFPKRTKSITWRISTESALVPKTEKTSTNEGFTATAKGTGQGTLTVMTLYYAPSTDKAASCKKFDFSVVMENVPDAKRPEGAINSVTIQICMRFLGATDSTMTILDVSMLTAFTPDLDDLDKLTNRVDKYISKYEMDTERSDRGSLIIYLDKVSNTQSECIKFKAHQQFAVGLIQPAAVTIYEYYSLENRCTQFYHPTKASGLLSTICKEDACKCVAEKCSLTNKYKLPMNHKTRAEAVCEVGVDYVYLVELLSVEENGMYDFFSMKIAQVIKEGSDPAPQGNIRRFISHQACRDSLNLSAGSKYLIWGGSADQWDMKTEMAYLIGSNTWVEPVPPQCGSRPVMPECRDLDRFIQKLISQGCTT
ncbi:complement C3-like isoform X2 [Ambystoma mexicanum]|uniref:complement C3-like isoform X2 n=1 Tax=Ambystoma mexicanum TaxID=8296 RepID=UPI0037E7D5FB